MVMFVDTIKKKSPKSVFFPSNEAKLSALTFDYRLLGRRQNLYSTATTNMEISTFFLFFFSVYSVTSVLNILCAIKKNKT